MARERFADVLDEAERSGAVVIERRDVKYVIRAIRKTKRLPSGKSIIETVDKDVASGQWSWDWTPKGVRFAARRRRS